MHSPVTGGFFWAHVGWIFAPDWSEGDPESVHDISRFPELRWLERLHWLPGYAARNSMLPNRGLERSGRRLLPRQRLFHHATFLVNSACHLWGQRCFETTDASRSKKLVAVLTIGEGWHNNHHHYQSSARQGFRWWEVDVSYYIIRLLSFVGLVWDVRRVPPTQLRREEQAVQKATLVESG